MTALHILILGALSMTQAQPAAPSCAAPGADAAHRCDHAINIKGTGATGRASAPACEHAINTKGTGASGRAAAPASDPKTALADVSAREEPRCEKIKFKQEFGPAQATKKS